MSKAGGFFVVKIISCGSIKLGNFFAFWLVGKERTSF